MKARFRKVWCSSCSTMQFAGECGHVTNVEAPPGNLAELLSASERRSAGPRLLGFARSALQAMPDELLEKMGLRRL